MIVNMKQICNKRMKRIFCQLHGETESWIQFLINKIKESDKM